MDFYNVDSKVVKRGVCLSCELCPEFEWHGQTSSSSCMYCGCLPTKHFKCLEEKNSTASSSNNTINLSIIDIDNVSQTNIDETSIPSTSTEEEFAGGITMDVESGDGTFQITETVRFIFSKRIRSLCLVLFSFYFIKNKVAIYIFKFN